MPAARGKKRWIAAGWTVGVAALVASIAVPAPVDAKTRRSCQGHYEVVFDRINDVRPYRETRRAGGSEARRGCGSAAPNRCRRRARDTLLSCFKAHWARRWTRNTRPAECAPSAGVTRYFVRDVKYSIERRVCCGSKQAFIKTARARIYGKTGSRHTACKGSVRLSDGYRFDCVALRAQGLCR